MPGMTPFQQDQAAAFARSQVEAQHIRAQQDLVRGADGPGAGGLNRAWGYFTDTAEEAAARAANVQKLAALRAAPAMAAATGQPQLHPSHPLAPVIADMQKAAAGHPNIAVGSGATLQERQAAVLNSMFRQPLTMAEATAATSMMPAVKPLTAKDVAVNAGTREAEQARNDALAAAAKESDPAHRSALEQTAREKYINYLIALGGSNPQNLAAANLPLMDPTN